ncbi:formate--tetrahydrofolate ligase [Bacillus weihaiensis]|uniref:formate--tetrahydrofolate ligase n=1 Tax=Bacillus weihaiensis TaxID=1547283 RepID=UPI003F6BCE7C
MSSKVYGARSVQYTSKALKQIIEYEKFGWGELPVCIAKTQYSLTDEPTILGKPENFSITIRELKISKGAGFIVALAGNIMTMPDLPSKPAALNMNVSEEGNVVGLF